MSNPILRESDARQIIEQAQRAMRDREVYVRLVACLASALVSGTPPRLVDGKAAISGEDFDAVPAKWRVDIERRMVPVDATVEGGPVEALLLVVLTERISPEKNGGIVAPTGPRLVLPGGAL